MKKNEIIYVKDIGKGLFMHIHMGDHQILKKYLVLFPGDSLYIGRNTSDLFHRWKMILEKT